MAYNELYHYGVKGMRWGVRKAKRDRLQRANSSNAKGIRANIGQGLKRSGNSLVRPFKTAGATMDSRYETLKKDGAGAFVRRSVGIESAREMRDINRRVNQNRIQKMESRGGLKKTSTHQTLKSQYQTDKKALAKKVAVVGGTAVGIKVAANAAYKAAARKTLKKYGLA